MATDGTLYDGATAYPHAVTVRAEGGRLVIDTGDGRGQTVEGELLVRADDGDPIKLGRNDVSGWRLVLRPPVSGDILALLPGRTRYGSWIDRLGLGRAAAIFGALAAAVVAVGYGAPHWLAPHVPRRWERNLGDAIVGDFGDLRCRSPGGQQALERLLDRVAPGTRRAGDGQIRIAALNVHMFNAAALPGGTIVVFRDAVVQVRGPDELAGILAHEVAHIRRRHVTEALLRELGIGALIRLFAGGVGANAQQIVSLSYTRANETQADSDAIAALRRAGIDPRPTANLFKRLAGKDAAGSSSAAEWLSSHPRSAGRAKRFAGSYDPRVRYTPALDRAAGEQLFNICRKGPAKVRPAQAPR